jgi:hypothetical protein
MKRWLSTKEAIDYSRIGRHRLKLLALQSIIKGCPDPDNKRGDWIIKGVKGEYYPCKPDIFEQTYEPAD